METLKEHFESILNDNTADEITDIIGNMLDTGGDNSFWSGRALAMMKGVLSILVPLRDNGLIVDPTGKKVDVLTLELLEQYIDIENLFCLYNKIQKPNQYIDFNYIHNYYLSINVLSCSSKITLMSINQHEPLKLIYKELFERISSLDLKLIDYSKADKITNKIIKTIGV